MNSSNKITSCSDECESMIVTTAAVGSTGVASTDKILYCLLLQETMNHIITLLCLHTSSLSTSTLVTKVDYLYLNDVTKLIEICYNSSSNDTGGHQNTGELCEDVWNILDQCMFIDSTASSSSTFIDKGTIIEFFKSTNNNIEMTF